MKRFMKFGSLALALVMSAATLAACGGGGSSTSNNDSGAGTSSTTTSNSSPSDTTTLPSGNTPSGGSDLFVYNLSADPKTLDPSMAEAVDASIMLANLFEGLTNLDLNNQPTPGVATHWELSEDGRTYTFHLREDAKWNDGQPVTARDFEYAWLRALDPNAAAPYAFLMFFIENAEAFYEGTATREELGINIIDDYTVAVTLEAPAEFFLELLSFSVFFPQREDIVSADPEGWSTKPSSFIGNGKYTMTQWNPQSNIMLVKNEHHWDADRIKMPNVDVKLVDDQVSGFASFRAGIFDVQNNVPQEEIQKGMEEGVVITYPQVGTYFFVFNLAEDKVASISPDVARALQDPRVREALSLAIDRTDIVDYVAMGGQQPAYSFIPPTISDSTGNPFSQTEYVPSRADLERAQQLLAEAGFPNGEGFPTILLSYNSGAGHESVSQAIQNMWREGLGIMSELQAAEWGVFQDQRTNGDFVIARHGWIADFMDPISMLEIFTQGSNQANAFFVNDEFERLVASAKVETDPATRDAMLRRAEDLIFENHVVIPLYYYTQSKGVQPYVQGLQVSPLGPIFFDQVVINK